MVDHFGVLAHGDDPLKDAYVPFLSPDNLDTSKKSLMVQEDTDDAKVWQHRVTSKLETGQLMLLKIPHPEWSSR